METIGGNTVNESGDVYNYEKELQAIAKGILLSQKPSVWDTLGWSFYNLQAKVFNTSSAAVLRAWKYAIDLQHKGYTYRYRAYATAEGIHANYDEGEAKRREEDAYVAAMSKWEDIKLKKIERVGNVLRFFTESNHLFQMDIKDVYSQTVFRQAFSTGTSIILPAIDPPSYDKFILSFKITVVEDVGTSLREKIELILLTQREKLRDSVLESEKETIEAVYLRGWGVYGSEIFFRSEKLLHELRKSASNMSMELLVSSLRDSGAILSRHRKFNYWHFLLPDDFTDEPL